MKRTAAAQRAQQRMKQAQNWPVRRYEMGQEPRRDPLDTRTADERIATVWGLSLEMWLLSGRPLPRYKRSEMPGRIVRGPA